MMVRLRLSVLLLALVLGVLCAFAVACGSADEGLLGASRAERLHDDLDAIAEGVVAGRCSAVDGRLASLRDEVERLPRTTDRRLVRRLEEGVAHLERQAPQECESAATTDTTDTTETTETTPTTPATTETAPETTATQPETTPEQPTPTTTGPEQPAPEPTTPAPTTPAEPQPEPGGAGGEEAPGGGTPPGAQAP